jgi:hypothetical protein
MTNDLNSKTDLDKPTVYEIKIEGHLGYQWIDWFGNARITLEDDGNTLLTCPVIDQAALFRLLKKVRDLGIPLVSVIRVNPDQSHESGINSKNHQHRSRNGEQK